MKTMKNINAAAIQARIKGAEKQLENARKAYTAAKAAGNARGCQVAMKSGNQAKAKIAELQAQLGIQRPTAPEEVIPAPTMVEQAPVEAAEALVSDETVRSIQAELNAEINKLIVAYKQEEAAMLQRHADEAAALKAKYAALKKAANDAHDARVSQLLAKSLGAEQQSAAAQPEVKPGSAQDVYIDVSADMAEEVAMLYDLPDAAPEPQFTEEEIDRIEAECEIDQDDDSYLLQEEMASASETKAEPAVIRMQIAADVDVLNACANAMMEAYSRGIKKVEYVYTTASELQACGDCVDALIRGAENHGMEVVFVQAASAAESTSVDSLKGGMPETNPAASTSAGIPAESTTATPAASAASAASEEAASSPAPEEISAEGAATSDVGYHCSYFDGCETGGSMDIAV